MGVWIDSDFGADDLFAILMLASGREIDGVSISFGCALFERVRSSAGGAAETFGWTFPVWIGADRAVMGGVETAERILGPKGMHTRGRAVPESGKPEGHFLAPMIAWLEREEKAEILALGPLTNLAVLALARPDLLERIGRLVWMGGAVGMGNHTASAEFNAYADPEALAILLSRDVPLEMVDLDACRQVSIDESDVSAVRAGSHPQAGLLADLLGGYLDIALTRGRYSMSLYDPVAAALMMCPEWFELIPAKIAAEVGGTVTRGRTVVDRRGAADSRTRIVGKVEADPVRALFLTVLGATP